MDSMFNTPQEVVQANINGAAKKASTSKKKVFFMGIMAGVCIALGAQSSNVAMHDIANVGLARLVAGCVFPVGLMMIVFIGGELFTGDCMMTMACIKKKISVAALVRTLVIVYFGNMVGAVALAGGNDLGQCLQFRVVDCHILDIIQHAVGPQVAGDIVEDQAVDLALLIQRIVADIQKIQVCPR